MVKVKICQQQYFNKRKEALAIRRIFSLVDMITKAKFSNRPNVFKIRLFGQYNMYNKHQNMFQSDSSFTKP